MQGNGFRLDSQLALALKTNMQAEAIANVLFPETGVVALMNKYIRELALEQVTADNITKVATKEGTRLLREVVQRMPTLQEATLGWLDQYQSGRFELHLDTSDLTTELKSVRGTIKQITIGIILIGMLIGSAIAASVATIADDFTSLMPRVAFVGYTVSMFLAAALVVGLVWQLWKGEPEE